MKVTDTSDNERKKSKIKRKIKRNESESGNNGEVLYLIVESRVVGAPESKQLNEPLVEHLLPFCHHVPLKVAKGLLAGEGDLEELWELSGQMLVEEEEVAVSAQNLPPVVDIIFTCT